VVFLAFAQDILSTPALLVGFMALLGLLLQRASVSDCIKGTFKTILGFVVIGGGAGILVSSLLPFGEIFQIAFNVRGVVPNNEAIVSLALLEYGQVTALIMVFGMVANLLIARFTPLKYIFLTGHHTLYMACLIGVVLISAGFNMTMSVVIGSVVLGLTMVIFPAISQRTMREVTKSNDVAMGHFSSLGYALSGEIGALVGKGSKSTEELNFPKGLTFLRDSSLSIMLTMLVVWLVVAGVAGQRVINDFSDGQNWVVYALMMSVTFAAGVFVVLAGVRLVLNEIVPAFKGISEKLVPGAKPALDCPVAFTFAPNAVIIGFFSSFTGGIIGMLVLAVIPGAPVILPGVIPHFFCGATAGVFGNARGGLRGTMIGGAVNGLLLQFAPVFLLPVLGGLGYAETTFSDLDFIAAGIGIGSLARIGTVAVIVGVLVVLAGLVIGNFIPAKAKKEAKETEKSDD